MCSKVSIGRESEERIRIGEAGSDRSSVEWNEGIASQEGSHSNEDSTSFRGGEGEEDSSRATFRMSVAKRDR